MPGDLFKNIARWEFDWHGQSGKLPVFYFDNMSITAIYTADTAKVRACLPSPLLKPLEQYPGRAMVAFTAFEYRDTDIGPYNEFSIAFLVTAKKHAFFGASVAWQMIRRRFTAYVWQLPVTTEIARVGGVDLYGYPKFIADIGFERKDNWVHCEVKHEGAKILSLSGGVLPTSPGKRIRLVTYSFRDGIPIVTNVVQDPLEFAQSAKSGAARLEIGDGHPIADQLRQMGLSEQPVLYQFSPKFEAILFAGRNLLDD